MCGAELALFFSPLFVAGEEKRTGDEMGDQSQVAVRQSLKLNKRGAVTREVVGFAVGG